MPEPLKSYDFVYVHTDIPEGMTIREWRAERAGRATRLRDAQRAPAHAELGRVDRVGAAPPERRRAPRASSCPLALERAALNHRDIPVYTGRVKIVKIRRVGNSNVVSIPRELEKSGYTSGSSVLVEELANGELRVIPTDRVRERIRDVGRRVVAEHPEALEILANHDPDSDSSHT